jgi:hypothetical protein
MNSFLSIFANKLPLFIPDVPHQFLSKLENFQATGRKWGIAFTNMSYALVPPLSKRDEDHHTWNINNRKLLKESKILCKTKNHKEIEEPFL